MLEALVAFRTGGVRETMVAGAAGPAGTALAARSGSALSSRSGERVPRQIRAVVGRVASLSGFVGGAG